MSSKSKKHTKSRPPATHHLSVPTPSSASTLTHTPSLTLFSPSGTHLAHVSLALDRCRLRVHDVESGRASAEWEWERGVRVGAGVWGDVRLEGETVNGTADAEKEEPPTKRRRRKSSAAGVPVAPAPAPSAQTLLILALTQPTPSVALFSPAHSSPLRTLSDPTCTSPPTAVATHPSKKNLVFSAHADGTLRAWDAAKGVLRATYGALASSASSTAAQMGYSALAVLPFEDDGDDVRLLAATHKIYLLSLPAPTASAPSTLPTLLATFSGHASPITALTLLPASSPQQFLTTAQDDRFVQLWDVPASLPTPPQTAPEGSLSASLSLPSPARLAAISPTSPHHLLALSARTLSLLPLPSSDPTTPSPKKSRKHAVPTLEPLSTITLAQSAKRKKGKTDEEPEAVDAVGVELAAAAFVEGRPGCVVLCSLAGGLKPVFEVVRYLNDQSSFIPSLSLSPSSLTANLLSAESGAPSGPSQTRYAEPNHLAVSSGLAAPRQEDDDGIPDTAAELDVNLAELSLGERLAAAGPPHTSSSATAPAPSSKPAPAALLPIPATSLSRTLTQALHSADTHLLESCLAHAEPALILTTVRRLPPQLAVPLLDACVERLGRGGRAGTGKGGGGAAGAERARVLCEWVRAVLVVHAGHLMTIPDLISRLADLYSTLSTRLALHPRLLALSGRLDLVLSALELRAAPAVPLESTQAKAKGKGKRKKQEGYRYVEGQSSDEGEGQGVDVEVEKGSEAGSVEDVELGGSDEEDEDEEDEEGEEAADVDMDGEALASEEDDEDEEDEEDEDGSEGGMPNGFIDDEAEETWEEDEEEDEESE